MDDYQIFISYRRQGGEFLGKLLNDRLEQWGYNVFYDIEDMGAGLFNRQIMEAIKQATDVILVLSANALDRCCNEDDWVRQEIEWAVRCGKNIIPVMTRDFVWPKNLPQSLARLQYYHGIMIQNDNFDAAFQKLCSLFLCKASQRGKELSDRTLAQENTPTVKKLHTESNTRYSVKTPLIMYFKSNSRRSFSGNELALDALAASYWKQRNYISGRFKNYEDMYMFTGAVSCDCMRQYTPWFSKNEQLIDMIRKKCTQLLNYTYKGRTGQTIYDLKFYVEFVKFGMELWMRQRRRRSIPDTDSAIYFEKVLTYIFDWNYDAVEKAYSKSEKSYAQYYAQYLFAVIEWWPGQINLNDLKSNDSINSDYSSFAIRLLDVMIDMYTLFFDCWPDDAEKKFAKTKLLCNYKYLKKQHIFLPEDVQKKFCKL